jgi:HD domain
MGSGDVSAHSKANLTQSTAKIREPEAAPLEFDGDIPDRTKPHAVIPRPHSAFVRGWKAVAEKSGRNANAIPLEHRLRELQRRSREIISHELLAHSGAASLRQLARLSLDVLKSIDALWRRSAGERLAAESAAQMVRLVDQNHRLLDSLEEQFHLVDAAGRSLIDISRFAQRLLANRPVHRSDIAGLSIGLVEEARRKGPHHSKRSPPLPSLPFPGVALGRLVEARTGETHLAPLVSGLLVAQWTAWALAEISVWYDRLPRMVLAAILSDVGLLYPASKPAGQQVRGAVAATGDDLERMHPLAGAALLGAILAVPPELTAIVAQHHERLDGGGYPRRLVANEIVPSAAIVAAVTRFVELYDQIPARTTGSDTLAIHARAAAHSLLEETRRGWWTQEFVEYFASRVIQATESMESESEPQGGFVGSPAGGGSSLQVDRATPAFEEIGWSSDQGPALPPSIELLPADAPIFTIHQMEEKSGDPHILPHPAQVRLPVDAQSTSSTTEMTAAGMPLTIDNLANDNLV